MADTRLQAVATADVDGLVCVPEDCSAGLERLQSDPCGLHGGTELHSIRARKSGQRFACRCGRMCLSSRFRPTSLSCYAVS
jgi:hypothetical protein